MPCEVVQGRPDSKLAKPGKKVVVKYVGKLKSTGKIFDQTQGNRTFTFRLGVGEVRSLPAAPVVCVCVA